MKNFKTFGIFAGVVLAIICFVSFMFITTNNKAITLEEQINGAYSEINVQEKRRVDLIYNLVDTVEDYAEHEKTTFTELADARNQINNGNIEEVQTSLEIVAEAYPELKANENYNQLMTELAVTENKIAQTRTNYNNQVKEYNKFVRKFPNSMILNISGYESLEIEYTNFDVSEDAPTNLFD